jgi:hypothetical protein
VNLLIVVLAVAAVVLLVVVVISLSQRRTPRSDDGVESFQKHLRSLSPEARRQSIDRVNRGPRGDD